LLLASCVKNGTHYADLTGELFWLKDMMARYDEEAKQNKVKLVPVCGFDSVPSDLGAKCVAEIFRKELNEDTKHVKGVYWGMKGGFSGGTVASGMEMTSSENISKTIAMSKDPQSLNPSDNKNGLDVRDPDNCFWDPELKQYLSPFIMGPLNSRVVRRSNALNKYGPEFTYEEWMKSSSWFNAKLITWGMFIANVAMASPYLRPIAQRVTPKPGEGPEEKDMPNGYAKIKYFGESAKTGRKAVCELTINGDPGYYITARMIAEAGLDMALNSDKVPAYGFLTPASGLSEDYFQALLQNGFEVKTELVESFSS